MIYFVVQNPLRARAFRPSVLSRHGMNNPGHPSAEAQVDCFDYGAWSDFRVTAEMADGRSITGHFNGDRTAHVIPLSNRFVHPRLRRRGPRRVARHRV